MKKINLIKLMSLIFVCAMLMGTIVLTAFAADEQDAVEIYSKNINFGEKLQLVFAVKAAEGAQIEIEATDANGNPVAIVEATDNNGNHYTTVDSASKGPAECYLFKTANGFSLYDIDATVTVTVKVGEATDSVTYSVLEYLFEREAALTGELTAEQQKQKAMYAALRVFADATAQVVENAPAGKFDTYKYVTVIGGTLDGYDSTGVFANGDKPFGNLVPNIELEAGYTVAWVVNGDTENPKTPAEMKDVPVDGDMTVEAIPVKGTCTHVMSDPTCTEDAYCTLNCGYVEEGSATGHSYENGECTVCHEKEPAAGTHTCDSVCEECGLCTDAECGEDACANKCQGHKAAPTYVEVTDASQITSGRYVLVVNGYVMTQYSSASSGWVLVEKFNETGDSFAAEGVTNYWDLTVNGQSVTLKDSNGAFIKPKSGNTNGIQTGEYNWAWAFSNGTVTFKGTGSDTTVLAGNTGSQNKIRAYKTSTATGTAANYPIYFTLYKLVE